MDAKREAWLRRRATAIHHKRIKGFISMGDFSDNTACIVHYNKKWPKQVFCTVNSQAELDYLMDSLEMRPSLTTRQREEIVAENHLDLIGETPTAAHFLKKWNKEYIIKSNN